MNFLKYIRCFLFHRKHWKWECLRAHNWGLYCYKFCTLCGEIHLK